MSKLSLFYSRVKSGSIRRLFDNVNLVHAEFGKPKVIIFLDMCREICFHSVGYLEYYVLGFAGLNRAQRKTFMIMPDTVEMERQLNTPEGKAAFNNKATFNRLYSAELGRDWVDLDTAEDYSGRLAMLKQFAAKHPVFFAKQPLSFGGLGVARYNYATFEKPELLLKILDERHMTLLEEPICQHTELNRLCPDCVNTLRICTLVSDSGTPHCIYGLIRVGRGGKPVDNVSSGGMYTLISPDGTLNFPAFCDKKIEYYTEHPKTGTSFIGYKIPFYKEAVDLCLASAQKAPGLRYIGWDVAITPTGPVLVEGNPFPGYDMPQNHRFHPDGIGLKPAFIKAWHS